MDPLDKRWSVRQELLGTLLAAHDAQNCDYRCDLVQGHFWWQRRESGKPVVVAAARVLCSYALSDSSVLMGWANRSLPDHSRVPAVPELPERLQCNEVEAWQLAMRIAEACGAHFIYRAPNPQLWVFLGLWDVRSAGPDEAPFVAGSPWPHVSTVIASLSEAKGERRIDELRVLLRNYGQTFIDSPIHHGTSVERPLREIGERLVALASAGEAELARGLEEVSERVRRLQSS
jgi:hypothetical protein